MFEATTSSEERVTPVPGSSAPADLLVERLTGQHAADAVPVEIHLVMTDTALLGDRPP